MSMLKNDELNILIQELSKKNPNTNLLKNKTGLLGIPYNHDLIALMTDVLVFLSQKDPKKSYGKDKPA